MDIKEIPRRGLNAEPIRDQLEELNKSGLTKELKDKISQRFMMLAMKNPTWKISRALRKAGEFYNVKFEFNK